MTWWGEAREDLADLLGAALRVPVDRTPYQGGNGYPRAVVGTLEREYVPTIEGTPEPDTLRATITIIGGDNTPTGFDQMETLVDDTITALYAAGHAVLTTETVAITLADQTLPGTEITLEVQP